MSRWWTESAAIVFDALGGAGALLLLLAVAGAVAALAYWFPAWVPRRLPRFPLPRRKHKPVAKKPKAEVTPVEAAAPVEAAEPVPMPAPDVLLSLADRLATEGRYAEAIRERLRATVSELVRAGVVRHEPGWTVTELAHAAAAARPAVTAPLTGATEIFTVVWYAQRPATAAQDGHMRQLTAQVSATLPVRGGTR